MVFLRVLTLVTWLAVGVTAVMWLLPLGVPRDALDRPVAVSTDRPVPAADWSVLAGRPAAAVEVAAPLADASRFQLIGVAGPVSPGQGRGVALMAVDAKTPRAFRVGDPVDERLVVLDIAAHTVKLGVPGSPTPALVLQAPLLPAAATGVLPAAPAPAPATGVPG